MVEEAIRNPDTVETKRNRRLYLKCPSARHIMLLVVTPADDPDYVIIAYFDRTRPCA